jgi:hypothetical protein
MAGASGVKTRYSSGSSLAEYLGPGRVLQHSEFPTLRSTLRQGLLFKEEKMLQEGNMRPGRSYSYQLQELVSDMTDALLAQWRRANIEFKPPVTITKYGIEKKLKLAWETAQKIASKHITKQNQIKAFEEKLDKLLDITKCKCVILLCQESGCPGCEQGAHITCSCPTEEKIPLLEIRFMFDQREKTGDKGAMMISTSVDMIEQKKKEKKEARAELELKRKENRKENEDRENQELEKRKETEKQELQELELQELDLQQEMEPQQELESRDDEHLVVMTKHMKTRNMVEVSGLASTALRYQASSRVAAACATAYLGDLIRAGVLPPEAANLAVDGAKVQRAKDKVIESARERGDERMEQDAPKCIMMDSRIDKKTLVMYEDEETKKYYPRIEAEDHYTITDGDGRYLHHFTKPGRVNEADETSGEEPEPAENKAREEGDREGDVVQHKELQKLPAEVVARIILNWLNTYGVEKTLTHLGADSTGSNTGWRKGIIAWLEKLLGKKLHWLICMLHTNELGLRRLVEKLDGKTSSKTGFSGPLGKMLTLVKDMEPKFDFKKIDVGPEVIKLPEDVVRDLSRDQKLIYQRWSAVRTGTLTRDVALCKPGPIVHSRWLTTAETFLTMYQSNHRLEGELLERLEVIVTYIVSVYCPMWFLIKVKHSWLEGPRHILTELSLFRLQSPEVQTILLPTLRRSAWNSHSESVLQTMLCSKDRQEREFAISTILRIRGRNKLGNIKPRPRHLPQLNVEATELKDLIAWKGATEPLLTCGLTKEEIKQFKEEAMQVPYYCLHTQGIERAVHETTKASETVYGFERRDGFIRGRVENRSLMPALNSKKDLVKLLL